jgi:hypothetical protein
MHDYGKYDSLHLSNMLNVEELLDTQTCSRSWYHGVTFAHRYLRIHWVGISIRRTYSAYAFFSLFGNEDILLPRLRQRNDE